MDPMKTPPGPWSPDQIPEKGNMHIHWVMTSDTLDNKSHYYQSTFVQNPDRQVGYGNGEGDWTYPLKDMIQHFWQQAVEDGENGQFNNKNPQFHKNDWQFVLAFIMMQVGLAFQEGLLWEGFGGRIIAVLLSLLLCCAWCCIRCALCCRRRFKKVQDHPAVKCVQETPCCPDGATKVAEAAVKYTEVVQHDD
jgi:hypothetical protein